MLRKIKLHKMKTAEGYTITAIKTEPRAYASEGYDIIKDGKVIVSKGDRIQWKHISDCWVMRIYTNKGPKRIEIWVDTGYQCFERLISLDEIVKVF